jgi:hypothetical protein
MEDTVLLSDAELAEIAGRVAAATPGPWRSLAEGRDHWGGDNWIELPSTGERPELYLSYGTDHGVEGASVADQDFVAHARQDIPRLLAEIGRLRGRNRN